MTQHIAPQGKGNGKKREETGDLSVGTGATEEKRRGVDGQREQRQKGTDRQVTDRGEG